MDLKSAREYSSHRQELDRTIATHEPAESPYESLPLGERFDWAWQAIDDLAGDELDKTEVTISGHYLDDSNLGVIFRRQFGDDLGGEGRKDRRSIYVTWTYLGEEFAAEFLHEKDLQYAHSQHSSTIKRLRLVEESVIAAQNAKHPQSD